MTRYRTALEKVRCGGRNYLRTGDPCYVRPDGADKTGFRAIARRITVVDDGRGNPTVEVDVTVARLSDTGHPQRKAGTTRTVPLERVERRRARPAFEEEQ